LWFTNSWSVIGKATSYHFCGSSVQYIYLLQKWNCLCYTTTQSYSKLPVNISVGQVFNVYIMLINYPEINLLCYHCLSLKHIMVILVLWPQNSLFYLQFNYMCVFLFCLPFIDHSRTVYCYNHAQCYYDLNFYKICLSNRIKMNFWWVLLQSYKACLLLWE